MPHENCGFESLEQRSLEMSLPLVEAGEPLKTTASCPQWDSGQEESQKTNLAFKSAVISSIFVSVLSIEAYSQYEWRKVDRQCKFGRSEKAKAGESQGLPKQD